MRFDELPDSIRDAVQQVLGSTVVDAVSQPGGFSSGTADRVRTAVGGTAFVKAMSQAMNAGAADLHRREARITAALAAEVSVPQLLGFHDDGEWVVLVFEDVNGRHPALPWRDAELAAVLAALRDLAVRLTPSPVLDVARAADILAEPFAGWQRTAASPPADLDPWRHGTCRCCVVPPRTGSPLSAGTRWCTTTSVPTTCCCAPTAGSWSWTGRGRAGPGMVGHAHAPCRGPVRRVDRR